MQSCQEQLAEHGRVQRQEPANTALACALADRQTRRGWQNWHGQIAGQVQVYAQELANAAWALAWAE